MSWHYIETEDCASSPCSPGQGAGSSVECCSGGEPLQPLKSKTTHAAFYCNGRLTASYLDSLSGTTCAPSMGDRGAGGSMSSAEGSPARTSARPARAQGSPGSAPAFGLSFPASSARFDRDSSSWRIHPCLFPEDSMSCSVTLPRWGMMLCGVVSELTRSEGLISAIDSGCWRNALPTPTAQDARNCTLPPSQKVRDSLPGYLLRKGRLPTATAEDARRGVESQQARRDRGAHVGVTLNDAIGAIGGKLSPALHLWMLAWPTGWNALDPLGMDKIQQWRRSHGGC